MKKVISVLLSTVLLLSLLGVVSAGAGAATIDKSFTSNKAAKQKWNTAYDTFYSGFPEIKNLKVSYLADSEYKIRQELIYPIRGVDVPTRDMDLFLETARKVKIPSQFEKLMVGKNDFGAVVEYVNTGEYYGEATIFLDRPAKVARIQYEQKYKVGDYKNRYSMTITEGVENQLLAKKFSPKTTTAHALRLSRYANGVYFKDGEKTAFYCSGVELNGSELKAGRLYTTGELSKDMEKIARSLPAEPSRENPLTGKPVIYLYPIDPTDVSVKLGYSQEKLTYTYPEYNGGWNVTAYPDGRIVNKSDKSEHWYLFWEGDKKLNWNFDEGFVVKGSDTERFLREKLSVLGLTTREMNDFITYWAPEMSRNEYNMVTFSKEQYEQLAPLYVSPAPDTVLRVHMVYKPCEAGTKIKPQRLGFTERRGFTVVEWGGTRA